MSLLVSSTLVGLENTTFHLINTEILFKKVFCDTGGRQIRVRLPPPSTLQRMRAMHELITVLLPVY